MSSHRIAIMTDSTSDLPAEIVRDLGIEVLPLYVMFGDDHLRDGVDIDAPAFYERLSKDAHHPSTSQPTPADFVRAIEACEADEIVAIHISSRMSGTIESVNAARENVKKPVHVIDSMSVSMGLGFQAMAAARARNAGASAEEIIAAAAHARDSLQVVFTVDTLEYLHRGGRIGSAAKMLGTALQLKPVLTIPTSTGVIDAVERVRSRKKALAGLPVYVLERIDGSQPLHVAVMHALAPVDAEAVLADMRTRVNMIEEINTYVGPIVGTHTGPGVLGLAVHID